MPGTVRVYSDITAMFPACAWLFQRRIKLPGGVRQGKVSTENIIEYGTKY